MTESHEKGEVPVLELFNKNVIAGAVVANPDANPVVTKQSEPLPVAKKSEPLPVAKKSGPLPDAKQSGPLPDAKKSGPLPDAKKSGPLPDATKSGTLPVTTTQAGALPLATTQSGALPATATQPGTLPLATTQSEALPATATQPGALPVATTQAAALPEVTTQPGALPLATTQSGTLPVATQQSETVPFTKSGTGAQTEISVAPSGSKKNQVVPDGTTDRKTSVSKGKSKSSKHATKITFSVLYATFAVAIGTSFIFGYNIGVLNTPTKVIQQFYNETYTDRYGYHVTEGRMVVLWGFTTALFFPGGMCGSFLGGYLADKWGRKRTVMLAHSFTFAGSLLASLCVKLSSPELLMISRILFGMTSGIGNCLAPVFLSEIAPLRWRGALAAVHQLSITLGIFISSLFGLREVLGSGTSWPMLFLLEGICGVIALCCLPFYHETPRYLLLTKNDKEKAILSLQFYRGHLNTEDEIEEMLTEKKKQEEAEQQEKVWTIKDVIYDKMLRWPLTICCLLQVIQQFSGINAIFFYSDGIFRNAGLPDDKIQYSVMATNLVNFAITVPVIPLIDRVGRRPLLLYPMMVITADLALITLSLNLQSTASGFAYLTLLCVFIYVIGFALGLGPVPTMLGSELFRQGPRSIAMSLAGIVNWVCTFIIAMSFEGIQLLLGNFTFLLFLILMAIFTVFVYFKIPETKNKTIEEIAGLFDHDFKAKQDIEQNLKDQMSRAARAMSRPSIGQASTAGLMHGMQSTTTVPPDKVIQKESPPHQQSLTEKPKTSDSKQKMQ